MFKYRKRIAGIALKVFAFMFLSYLDGFSQYGWVKIYSDDTTQLGITTMNSDSVIYGLWSLQGIFKSANHGMNWTQVASGQYRSLEVSPDNSNIVYAGTSLGLYRSTNGGQSWALYNDSFNPSKIVIGISKDAGSGDTVIATTTDAVYKVWGSWVGINTLSEEIPEKFVLYQNFPNPFNPVTRIKFDIPLNVRRQTSNVKLITYDVLGKELAALVNEELKPGTYEVEFDGANYPSGVYFYQLTAENYIETRKMVLIK